MADAKLHTIKLPYPDKGGRNVWVYVPSHSYGEKLPVVYMTDGQNLFDDNSTPHGSWEVAKAVENNKGGQVNFRVDKQGNIHAGIGKISFAPEQIRENFEAFIKAINKHKPAAAKGKYIKSAAVSLTMSPSMNLENQELIDLR